MVKIRKTVRFLFELVGYKLIHIGEFFYKIKPAERITQWIQDQGDKTYRLNYDLNKNSLVFDIGGYEGQWASDIFAKYCCTIHIFEPVIEFANKIEKRFLKNDNIFVHKFGLSNRNMVSKISLRQDESSLYISSKQATDAHFKRAVDLIKEDNFEKIDLMKINIEGGEYDLIEDLIGSGLTTKIRNIQIQFHDFIPDSEIRMLKIQEKLKRTHYLTYQYLFVWENWQLK